MSTDLTSMVMGGGETAENIPGCRKPPAYGPQAQTPQTLGLPATSGLFPGLVQQLPN